MRILARALVVGSIAAIGMTPSVSAQRGPAIEAEAMSALTRMGGYLRTLTSFQVEGTTNREDVLEDGQKVQFTGLTRMLVKMPDRFHIAADSDRHHREFFYDGKNFSLLARRAKTYATVAAPPTIAALLDELDDRYAVALPLEDLFRWGGAQSKPEAITSAMFIGPSEVGGVTCGHYAFRQEGLDWQVWIQMGDHPLPRKIVLTTMTDEARPQYMATFNWNLAPSFNDATFTFVPPQGVGRVVLGQLKK
jgi:hypothetical protein